MQKNIAIFEFRFWAPPEINFYPYFGALALHANLYCILVNAFDRVVYYS